MGLTQSPPGKHLEAVQARFAGSALLCIDVSGSMSGSPLNEAVAGGLQFLVTARENNYECGLVLWHHDVETHVPIGSGHRTVEKALRAARSIGGNDFSATLTIAENELAPRQGDRVLCVFGDGDIGHAPAMVPRARQLCAQGVRIVVSGLGPRATEHLSVLLCPGDTTPGQVIADVSGLRAGIAAMADKLSGGLGLRNGS
ncbi:vWA domain-containing protein [Actinokineospora sp. G85]|uniref:vWA domain-containing protein n=1 Tax=Actinokineospora sp. G85 TaxID=3406626 RepID=UPI003C72EE7B